MSYAASVLRQTARRLLVIQVALVLATALGFLFYKGGPEMLAASYGGAIALLNTLISANRLRRASEAAVSDAKRGMMELYIGAIMRFIGTPLFVALGILALGLDPIAIIAGFGIAQLAYFFNSPHAPTTNSN
jgi:ATP synthase protein I